MCDPVEVLALHRRHHLQRIPVRRRGDDARIDVGAKIDQPVVLAVVGDLVGVKRRLRCAGESPIDAVVRNPQDELRKGLVDALHLRLSGKAAKLGQLESIGNAHPEPAAAFEDETAHPSVDGLHEINGARRERPRRGVTGNCHRRGDRDRIRGVLPFLQSGIIGRGSRRIEGRMSADCAKDEKRNGESALHKGPLGRRDFVGGVNLAQAAFC